MALAQQGPGDLAFLVDHKLGSIRVPQPPPASVCFRTGPDRTGDAFWCPGGLSSAGDVEEEKAGSGEEGPGEEAAL